MIIDLTTVAGRRLSADGLQFASFADDGRIFFDGGEAYDLSETVKVYDDMAGEWYLFGGHCMHWAIIRAGSFCDAYDIYLDEYCGESEEPESEGDSEYGSYTSSGKWFSEVTTSYIANLPLSRADAIKVDMIAD